MAGGIKNLETNDHSAGNFGKNYPAPQYIKRRTLFTIARIKQLSLQSYYQLITSGTASVLERTQKIFYVCCTRAMENLAVFFHNPSAQVIAKAKQWFGEAEVIQL